MPASAVKRLCRAALAGGTLVFASCTPAAASREAPAKAAVLEVTTEDFSFDAPSTIPAGLVTIHLTNHGSEAHHVWLARLGPGRSVEEYLEAARAGAPPRWAVNVGGPNAVAPGGEASATVVLTPGRYALLCFIPSADGVPHMMKGMASALTVTGADPHASLPAADLTLRLADYGFAFSQPLTAGRHVVRVRNEAAQPHEVTLWRLGPGGTPEQIAAWAEHPTSRPPALPLGGITGIDQGREANWVVNLEPGDYALLCFVPDAHDGRPHTAHGMMEKITVR